MSERGMSERGARGHHWVWRLVASVSTLALMAMLVVTVFPIHTYLDQRTRTRQAEHDLAALTRQNHDLERRIVQLRTPAEIERLARASYGMVKPGELSYAVLPAPAGPLQPPDFWPYRKP